MIDARLPLYQQLRDQIIRRIEAGEWTHDRPIPGENELAAGHDVAVGTVRKALDSLVTDGLLVRRRGKGTFLRRPSFDGSFLRFFRNEDRDGVRRVPGSHILRRSVASADAKLAALLRIAPGMPTIRVDRLRTIDDEVIFVEEIRLARERFETLASLPVEHFGPLLYPLYERLCGQIVASATETLTVVAAGARDARVLGIAVAAPLIEIERVALNLAGDPIEWRRSRGRGDRFRYRVDLR